ncbi:helix-turn-helix domain-containing protein [Actinoplanes friuliensis]|jgi:transcriptional regulator with XRE-family HTH domain|uniref:XRE family transcriptional regulator n=1 Tax=Actinoplanes friuliensis DSM 7358 TaxID=1246995 RepID=U5VR07_9ACTN|nr:helix-turn-helix transcriptional regulator [Actinoplanes friuliensis]AGZ39408.1 XRE family transcriptional regulator [Actinoplanes friuliensis DSM 7358]
MDAQRQLGEFLQTRRSQLRPEDVGVATYGGRRRVPGLRREELALLAGVSASYYSRLEQGQAANASPEVLDALARALRLNETERLHLDELATGSRRRTRAKRPAPEKLSEATRQLVAALGDVPVVVLGRRSDVLAWNPAGHSLFAGHLAADSKPNLAWLMFFDTHTRALYADWPAKARAVVATLRMASGRHPDDPLLAALVGELSVKSPEFVAMWADHRVKAGGDAVYEMLHPLVGPMRVTQQALWTEGGQAVVVATTEAGSPSQAAMTLLVHSRVTGPRLTV